MAIKNILPKFPKNLGILVILLFLVDGTLSYQALLDDDTIGIGEIAESFGRNELEASGRQSRRETYTSINGQNIMISCTTARNRDGECKPFGECYPLFKLREQRGNDKRVQFPNKLPIYNNDEDKENRVFDELQNIYRGISGPCSDFTIETISKALGHPVPKRNYVCCPMESNHTRVTRPSQSAGNSPVYQNQQCGGSLYSAKSENETDAEVLNDENLVEGRVVNGRVAGRNEFPWAVALLQNGRQFCGGSLIDSHHVLTAAHCIYFMNGGDVKRLRLQIGDHNIYSTNDGSHETRGARNVYYHKAFSMRTLTDDVALIRLSQGVRFSRHIQPICLSTNSWAWEGQTASVAGWGKVSERGQQSSVLRTVNVRIWKQNDCARRYRGKAPAGITKGMVCAGGQGYDSCQGDSGGPLNVWRNKRAEQLGIVSWGIGCGRFPGVYTRVSEYLWWINKNRQ